MTEEIPPIPQAESAKFEELPAEFDFHQKRFQQMADIHKQKWWVEVRNLIMSNILGREKMEAKDFAQVEARRDDAYFERKFEKKYKQGTKELDGIKERAEYAKSQERLKLVVNALLEKKTNPERKDIQTLLVIPGGGNKCSIGAGQALIALFKLGLGKAFDNVYGISGGAQDAVYFVGGEEQAAKGASIFYEECTTPKFINLQRPSQIMDVGFISETTTVGEKAFDEKAVMESPTGLYVGVTAGDSWEAHIVDAKTAKPSMKDALRASMTNPKISGDDIAVNGIRYRDGAFNPLPLKKLIEKFKPTHILVLSNIPFNRAEAFELSPGTLLFLELLPESGFLGFVKKFIYSNQLLSESLKAIEEEQDVTIGIAWPPDMGLSPVTTDTSQIEAAVAESARSLIKDFGGKQPKDLKLYHSGENNS